MARTSFDGIYDVIVVGAGLSGLTAANALHRDGYSVLVLEARDRVGGKTYSVDPLHEGKIVDVGAAWINDTNQSAVYGLAKELGLELVVQNTTGRVIQEDINGKVSTFAYGEAPQELCESNGLSEMLRIRQLFEDACHGIDIRDVTAHDSKLDQLTLKSWVEENSSSKTALASVCVWTRAMLGLEPDEISALHFLNYCKSGGGLLQMRKDTRDGGQYLRFVKGTQSMSKGLASRLPAETLRLSSPVTQINQSSDNTTAIISSGQSYRAKHIILSVPSPLYSTIAFSPPLPAAKSTLGRSTVQGYTNKIMLLYSSPWWRYAGLCGLIQSFTGPITVTRDSSVDSTGQYSLTCFLVGQVGRELSKLPQSERFDTIASHVCRVFSPFCKEAGIEVEEPMVVTEYEWTKDQWSQGCPVPAMPPGVMTQYERDLRTRFANVHFAGTETSFEWKGYMDGAVRSGTRVAETVAQALRGRTG